MTEAEFKKWVDGWCDWFVAHPFFALYQNKNYKEYKEAIETFNSFLSDKEKHAPIDTEQDYIIRCEILEALIEEGFLEIKEAPTNE